MTVKLWVLVYLSLSVAFSETIVSDVEEVDSEEFESAEIGEDRNDEPTPTTDEDVRGMEELIKHFAYPNKIAIPMYSETGTQLHTTDLMTFTKQGKNTWTTMRSADQLQWGKVSYVTVQLIRGNRFFLGALENRADSKIRSNHLGYLGGYRETGFYTGYPYNYLVGKHVTFGETLRQGDYLTMKVDLRPGHYNIEYFKNNRSLGMAYSGLNNWENVYLGISIAHVGETIRIVDFKETDK